MKVRIIGFSEILLFSQTVIFDVQNKRDQNPYL